MRDVDNHLAGDRVADEEGGADGSNPFQYAIDGCWQQLDKAYREGDDKDGHEIPCVIPEAEGEDQQQADNHCHDVWSTAHVATIACVEKAKAEGYHAANIVVAEMEQGSAYRVTHCLNKPARHHKGYRDFPSAAVHQQTVDDLQLYHKSEEPVWAWPDVGVGTDADVDGHRQHSEYFAYGVVIGVGCHAVDENKGGIAYYHHTEQLEVVVLDKWKE